VRMHCIAKHDDEVDDGGADYITSYVQVQQLA